MLLPRILTALVLLPLMLGMLFFANAPVWAIFVGLIALIGLWEYSRLVGMPKPMWVTYIAMSAAVGFIVYRYGVRFGVVEQIVVVIFWGAVVPLWLKFKWRLKPGFSGILVGWVLFFPFWLVLVQQRAAVDFSHGELIFTDNTKSLLAMMVLVWIADIGAYVFGRLFGKRKLAINISPGKSWEGAIGGFLCVLAYVYFIQYIGWWSFVIPVIPEPFSWALFALVFTAISVEGDLFESWLKRSAGIKDSSHLLPGHGGVFDRVDAMVSVLSVYAAMLAFLTMWTFS
ncbi:phosphatidate cytidylyltransferase [Neisseria sp. Ec49-e6-T10]|uniref:phosphatidate cytidylyltransferase n=1 Tax=Neisseria sp. Ec49-e6-T10 TaxID=3140744 RepID=UPI003EC128F5